MNRALINAYEDLERCRFMGYEPFLWTDKQTRKREIRFKKARSGQTKVEKAKFMQIYETLDTQAAAEVLMRQDTQARKTGQRSNGRWTGE